MADFSSNCPNCKSEVHFDNKCAGEKAECPVCSSSFTIPQKADPPAPAPSIPVPYPCSPSNAPANAQSNGPTFDEEDSFVLKSFKVLLTLNRIVFLLSLILAPLSIIISIFACEENTVEVIVALIAGVIVNFVVFWIIKLSLSWAKGIYKNLAILASK